MAYQQKAANGVMAKKRVTAMQLKSGYGDKKRQLAKIGMASEKKIGEESGGGENHGENQKKKKRGGRHGSQRHGEGENQQPNEIISR